MPYLALFSCRDIIKGEELSFDYLMSGATDDEPLDVSSLDNGKFCEYKLLPRSVFPWLDLPIGG